MTATQFEAELLKLPRSVRARLAERLIESLDENPDRRTDIEAAWSREADARYASYLEGGNPSVPFGPFLEALRKEYGV